MQIFYLLKSNYSNLGRCVNVPKPRSQITFLLQSMFAHLLRACLFYRCRPTFIQERRRARQFEEGRALYCCEIDQPAWLSVVRIETAYPILSQFAREPKFFHFPICRISDLAMFATSKPVPSFLRSKIKGKTEFMPAFHDGCVPFREKTMKKVLQCFIPHSVLSLPTVYFKIALVATMVLSRKFRVDNPLGYRIVSIVFQSPMYWMSTTGRMGRYA